MNLIDFVLHNKEWLFSGAGVATLTGLLVSLRSLLGWIRQARRGASRFSGTYEAYICRIRNDGTFLRSAMKVASPLHGYRVSLQLPRYSYRGRLTLLGHNVFLELRGIGHDGNMYCVFKEPLGTFDMMLGVFAAITSARLPVAGRILLRRVPGDPGQISPAFLTAEEAPSGIPALLQTNADNLAIVADLPVYKLDALPKEKHDGDPNARNGNGSGRGSRKGKAHRASTAG